MTASADAPEPPEGPLTDALLLDEASIYRSMWIASQGRMSPRDVDQLEIWEIATLLGHSKELEGVDKMAGAESTAPAPRTHEERAMELIKQRMAHAKGQGPKPEARPVDPQAFSELANRR